MRNVLRLCLWFLAFFLAGAVVGTAIAKPGYLKQGYNRAIEDFKAEAAKQRAPEPAPAPTAEPTEDQKWEALGFRKC